MTLKVDQKADALYLRCFLNTFELIDNVSNAWITITKQPRKL